MGPGKFEMFPEQTEQRLHLTLADARHQIEVELERKPSGIWNEDLYTSVPDSALLINMKFNAMEERVSFSVAINTQASLSIDQYISALHIYNAFQSGKVQINNALLPVAANSDNPVPNSVFHFWEGIPALQKRISQPFVFSDAS